MDSLIVSDIIYSLSFGKLTLFPRCFSGQCVANGTRRRRARHLIDFSVLGMPACILARAIYIAFLLLTYLGENICLYSAPLLRWVHGQCRLCLRILSDCTNDLVTYVMLYFVEIKNYMYEFMLNMMYNKFQMF